MCTTVILFRPGHAWPVVLAANRDERIDRPALPPARHWPDRLEIVAGLDREGGGTWLGLNDDGVIAGVLNRRQSLGPAPDKRSRGELPLEALEHATARDAADALGAIEPTSYRPFNMVVADAADAFWIASIGDDGGAAPRLTVEALPPGLSMITAYGRNDTASSRIRRYLPRFEAANAPDPDAGDWDAWKALMAAREHDPGHPGGAMSVVTDWSFGTVSSALIALPNRGRVGVRAVWLHAPGRPGEAAYEPVAS